MNISEFMMAVTDPYDYLFKFLVIGSAGTGKSCLLHQVRFIQMPAFMKKTCPLHGLFTIFSSVY